MKVMLLGDGEVEPNVDQITQLALEICKEDVIVLFFHKLSLLGWEVSNYDIIILYIQLLCLLSKRSHFCFRHRQEKI